MVTDLLTVMVQTSLPALDLLGLDDIIDSLLDLL